MSQTKTLTWVALILCLCYLPAMSEINDLHGFSPQIDDTGGFHLPFPPLSYGQYNSPITQKDMSQDDFPYDQGKTGYTREIILKQGRLKGIVRVPRNSKLGPVEVFMGIPYAAPPVGGLRFMPPGSPPNWRGVRVFDTFGPVCPQNPPDLSNEPLRKLHQRRYNTLKLLLPFLTNQSEDCLYLNIYTPADGAQRPRKLPVLVYIHGESFEWNSGNPYDGSIISSYGNVVVVTVNFRLGILGFLRPGISDITISNFGLLDQIAALQWVKENIADFGGDPGSVTLMGHGTGAACINFLMVSPVSTASDGLFHRAILMSGTALSDWSMSAKPIQVTIQVAEALNCPMADDELASCLRKKRLADILKVNVSVPEFETPFGPIVDGSVVPNTPEQLMGVYKSLFSRYELLYGMTQVESYHSLNVVSLTYGLLERERQQLLWYYMRARFEQMPDLALATTIREYTNWRRADEQNQQGYHLGDAVENRELVLDILSDARVGAPVIQMANYHANVNPKSYLYIFNHNSQFGEFGQLPRSISGEELAYVFGAPLSGGTLTLAHETFSMPEQLLSQQMLTFFTNFAKTGNPNSPHKTEYLSRDWKKHELIEWPRYEGRNQYYMSIGLNLTIEQFYRHRMMLFWNKILPHLLANPPTGVTRKPFPAIPPPFPTKSSAAEAGRGPNIIFGKPIEPPSRSRPTSTIYGVLKTSGKEEVFKEKKKEPMDGPMKEHTPVSATDQIDHPTSSMALTLFGIIGICFLVINIFAFSLLFYKRKRTQLEQLHLRQVAEDMNDGGFGERERLRGCGANIYDMVTGSRRGNRSETYDAPRMSRKCSASTLDPHAKVREWIIEKCSPSFLRRGRRVYREESQSELFEEIFEPKLDPKPEPKLMTQLSTQSEPKRLAKKNIMKVSIGIDATPGARSASVLKQTPIELTKSLDRGLLSKQTSFESDEASPPLRRSQTSVSLTLAPPSRPIMSSMEPIFSYDTPMDINVTSRDPEIILKPDTLPAVTLKNIQMRNYPKVLPDLPDTSKRISLQPGKGKNGPPPPPRTSTLDRKNLTSLNDNQLFRNSDLGSPSAREPAFEMKHISLQSSKEEPVYPDIRIPKTVIVAPKRPSQALQNKEPSIVTLPVVRSIKKLQPHVNIQDQATGSATMAENPSYIGQSANVSSHLAPVHMPDSKGPSEKVLADKALAIRAKGQGPEMHDILKKQLIPPVIQIPPKGLIRTNALDDVSAGSSSSSSIAQESTGTIKKGKKSMKSVGT